MASSEQLKSITQEITPKLEKVLATDSLTSQIPESLQLRYTQCGLATAALQGYLFDQHGIETERLINHLHEAPTYNDFSVLSHVILRADNLLIDPTHGQFMNFVGLTHKIAIDHDIAHLYPTPKIMVFPEEKAADFADKYAAHAHQLDQTSAIPEVLIENAPDGQLRGKPFAHKQRVYRSIWNPANYSPFPIDEQDPGIQEAAKRIVESLKRLDS